MSFRANAFFNMAIQVLGLAQLKGNLTVAGTSALHSTTVSGTLAVSAPAAFSSDVTVGGATTLNGATSAQALQATSFACHGSSQLGDTNIDACTVNATTVFTAPLSTQQLVSLQGPVSFGGGGAIGTTLLCTGSGRVVRPAVIGSQSGSTTVITPATATVYYFPTTSADQNFNLPALATEGDEIEVSTNGAGFYVNVRNPAGTTIRSLKFASGEVRQVRVKYIAGTWRELAYSYVP
ncbi:MAG: hypothetical protein ABUL62_19375 [Myxococcales bacterium]